MQDSPADPQLYLDPRQLDAQGTWKPKGAIPPAVREFGFYPNFEEWLPGDLILVSNLKPNFSHHVIERVQQFGGYDKIDARWHHAAIYLSDGDVCEANTSGVEHGSIDRYVGKHLIRVRRDFSLSENQRWRIAIRSLTRLKQGYAFPHLVDLFTRAVNGFSRLNNNFSRLPRKTKICSQLYADAYSPITGKLLQNDRSGEITPAFLSATPMLTDVSVCWRIIGSR